MKLSESIEALAVATIADGRSAPTVEDYRRKLGYLLTFLGDRPVEGVTVADLRGYVADMRSRSTLYAGHGFKTEHAGGLATATLATRIRAMKRLFKWLNEEGVIADNPAQRIKMPRLARGERPKAISEGDFQRILEAASGSARDYALVLFLADTGCRRGGLVGLTLSDLDLGNGRAWVTEKGNKRRAVFLSGLTITAVSAWLSARPAAGHPFVWLSETSGEPLTGDGVAQVLQRLGKAAGCTGPHGAHSFRHEFARQWILSGGDMGTLADVMGHADVQTTFNAYAVFSQNELQAEHAKHSPVHKLDGSHNHG